MIFFIRPNPASTQTHLGLSLICELWLLNKNDKNGDENGACFTAMEAGMTISFTAMEAGITKVVLVTATYTVMKMTRVSLQWKRE